jgi:hypothetical protein
MKTKSFFLILCTLTLLASSCNKDDVSVRTFELGESFELSLANPSAEADDLSITYINVEEDSRCPTDVVCFWEGRAVVNFEFTVGRNSYDVQLMDWVGRPEKAKTTIEQYVIQLEVVNPYPDNSAVVLQEKDYRFRLNITAL